MFNPDFFCLKGTKNILHGLGYNSHVLFILTLDLLFLPVSLIACEPACVRPRGVAAARPPRSPEGAFTQVPVISSTRPHLSVGLLYIALRRLILHPLGRSKKL